MDMKYHVLSSHVDVLCSFLKKGIEDRPEEE